METLRKHGSLIFAGTFIALIFYFIGVKKGENNLQFENSKIENKEQNTSNSLDFSPFWRAWAIIQKNYVPASTTKEMVTDDEKLYGAIQGLAESLGDPYTVFFPPVEAELFETGMRGDFEGVGMEVLAKNGAITVVSPLKNSPAEKAGMLSGDRIIRVDGKSTMGLTTEEAVSIIRGPKGSKVTFTVFREGVSEPFEISIVRELINIPIINSELIEGNIFKIDLFSFSEKSPNLFRRELRKFLQAKTDKLILDLRGNPGGYLEASVDMASWFLPPSKIVLREDYGGKKEERVYRSLGYDIFSDDLKFVILVDKGSASASEILAGALQEHGKAILVGEKTFGKGSVQDLVNITPDTSLKVTIARWLTPKGVSIADRGIIPDYVVERTSDDREKGLDPQLDKAIEILSKM